MSAHPKSLIKMFICSSIH